MPKTPKGYGRTHYDNTNKNYDIVRGVISGLRKVKTSTVLSPTWAGLRISMAQDFQLGSPRVESIVTKAGVTRLYTQDGMISLGEYVYLYVPPQERERFDRKEQGYFLVEVFPVPQYLPLMRDSGMGNKEELKEYLMMLAQRSEMSISRSRVERELRKGIFTLPVGLTNKNAYGVKLWRDVSQRVIQGERKRRVLTDAPKRTNKGGR